MILPMLTVSISMSLFSVMDVEVMARSGFTYMALPCFPCGPLVSLIQMIVTLEQMCLLL